MLKGDLDVNIEDSISRLKQAIKEFKLKEYLYQAVFRGKGLEFESYRVYGPDDDASIIDWKASSRSQKLLVKKYKEERDLKIIFVVDVGSNMVLGSEKKLKCELVAEMLAAFSYLILNAGDSVGFVIFSKDIKFFEPAKGEKQIALMMDYLSKGEIYNEKPDFNKVLDFVSKILNESISSLIFVSDFINFSKSLETKFNLLASRCEIVSLIIKDTLDKTLPEINTEIILQDPSSGQQMIVNPKMAKKTYEKYVAEKEKALYSFFEKKNIDYFEFMTTTDFAFPLANFLKERIKKGKIK